MSRAGHMRAIAVLLFVFLPGAALAMTQVYSSVSSYSNTGGQTVSGASYSSGGSSASVTETTIVNSGSGGGTVDAEITTERNGVVQRQSVHKDVAPGESVRLELGSSTSAGASVRVQAGSASGGSPREESVATTAVSAHAYATTSFPTIFSVPFFGGFFARIFAFFHLW